MTKHRSARRLPRSLLLGRAPQCVLALIPALLLAGPLVSVAAADDPNASFTVTPQSPVTGEPVTFRSTSTDSDGRVVSQAWDLDNDGSYDDGTGTTATRTFSSSGRYTVRLRVRDDDGDRDDTSRSFTVAVNRPPMASFTAPSEVDTGQAVTLTSTSTDPDGRPLTLEQWDLDNNGVFGDATGHQVTTSFDDNGTRTVALEVTDASGATHTISRVINVRNRPPQAAFELSSAEVDTGDPVEFTSTSTDPDGEVSSYAWDFNGDGTTDATGETASNSFSDDGEPTVRLTITDDDGASRSASRSVSVKNRAPSASFTYSPSAPLVDEEVVLTSTSTDRDGTVVEHRWDLDGDGDFDDATGAEVRTSFAEAGSHSVSLRVTDDDGKSSAPAFNSIDVAPRPPPPDPPAGDPPAGGPTGTVLVAPRLLSPFPRVRFRGVATRTGARLDLLSVRTTGGTRILVRCKGRGCPFARKIQRARFSPSRVRVVKISGFRRRYLRAGTVIEIYVTRSGMIGKYTRIRIVRMKAPKRVDRCSAGAGRVQRCPA